jgi:hypothetical protein
MMTDLSIMCPALDDIFQKVRYLLLKEATRLEEKHDDEDQVARAAVMIYKARREQEMEESRKRLARTRFAALFTPPVSTYLEDSHLLFPNTLPHRPLSQKPVMAMGLWFTNFVPK